MVYKYKEGIWYVSMYIGDNFITATDRSLTGAEDKLIELAKTTLVEKVSA